MTTNVYANLTFRLRQAQFCNKINGVPQLNQKTFCGLSKLKMTSTGGLLGLKMS